MPHTEEQVQELLHEMYTTAETTDWDLDPKAIRSLRGRQRMPLPDVKVLALVAAAVILVVVGIVLANGSHSRRSTASSPTTTVTTPSPRTVETSFSSTVGTVGVPASNYQVVVTASGPCWVQATDGTNAVLFSNVLPADQTRTFSAENGTLSVQLGSIQVRVSVQIDGKRVPSWRYTPRTSPFSLNFHSVT
jgi:hypothetical protein